MKKFLAIMFVGVMLFLGIGLDANATTITLTLGEFSSPYHSTGSYSDVYDVGTFTYDLSGESIISASISGQWGNSSSSTTAHNVLFLDGVELADTHDYSPDPYYTSYVPWSYTFTDFSVLQDGVALFQTVQTSEYVVRLGETTLAIETEPSQPIPEPTTMLLLGIGLVGLAGGAARRKFKKEGNCKKLNS